MPAVSCQVSAWILEHVEQVGLSAARLVDALPVGDEELRDPSRHLGWDHFTMLCEQIEALLGGRDALESAAQAFTSARLADEAANQAPQLTHSQQAYWLVAHWLAPSLLPGLSWSFTDLDAGRVELTVEIPSSERPCPQLFSLLAGVLRAVPQLLRQPMARVEVDSSERRAVFRIALKIEEPKSELRESEQRYRAIAESSRDVIIELAGNSELLYVTPNAREILGFEPTDLLGRNPVERVHPDDRASVSERVAKMLQTGNSEHMTFRVQHPDGGWRFLDTTATVYRTADGKTRSILVGRDVTARLRAEQALHESEERYRTLVENAFDLIAEADEEGRFVYVSPKYRELLGYASEDLLGTLALDLIHPEDREPVLAASDGLLRRKQTEFAEHRVRDRDGGWHWFETQLQPYRRHGGEQITVIISRDITARRQAKEALRESQEQLLHAQKMEAIGRLAGGVAHDFNNLLTAITGYGALLIESLGAEHPLRGDIEEIVRAADQAGSLTKQLLAFSRRQVLQPRVIDLNALVANVDRLLRRVIGEDIEFVTSLDSKLWPVRADPGQIEQLIMNLVVNARDAMPRGGGLALATSTLRVPEGGDPAHPGIPSGDWVRLSLQDTGLGMSADMLELIFEPFFTTKETGKGTGLGLATVYAIVRQGGGHVRVESEPGEGSTFSVYLPRASGPLDETLEQPLLSDLRGTETLLLVEDSESVRRLLRRYLERHGYTVIEAASGIDALRAMRHHDGPLDLLVADVVLPKMDGRVLARKLERERPGLRVIYISGFSDDALSDRDIFDDEATLLQKPFNPPELLRKIRTLLASPPPASKRDTRAARLAVGRHRSESNHE